MLLVAVAALAAWTEALKTNYLALLLAIAASSVPAATFLSTAAPAPGKSCGDHSPYRCWLLCSEVHGLQQAAAILSQASTVGNTHPFVLHFAWSKAAPPRTQKRPLSGRGSWAALTWENARSLCLRSFASPAALCSAPPKPLGNTAKRFSTFPMAGCRNGAAFLSTGLLQSAKLTMQAFSRGSRQPTGDLVLRIGSSGGTE